MTKNNIFENREMRTFSNGLATEVTKLHGSRCPCCASPMVNPRKSNNAARKRRDKITVAHDHPVGFGGEHGRWVYACQGCNTDQRNLTFRAWSFQLQRADDRRADAVAALADFIDTYYSRRDYDGSADRSAGLVSAET